MTLAHSESARPTALLLEHLPLLDVDDTADSDCILDVLRAMGYRATRIIADAEVWGSQANRLRMYLPGVLVPSASFVAKPVANDQRINNAHQNIGNRELSKGRKRAARFPAWAS